MSRKVLVLLLAFVVAGVSTVSADPTPEPSEPVVGLGMVVVKLAGHVPFEAPGTLEKIWSFQVAELDALCHEEGVEYAREVFPLAAPSSQAFDPELSRIFVLRFRTARKDNAEMAATLERLRASKLLEWAEADILVPVAWAPNDERYQDGDQWYLAEPERWGVNAEAGWDPTDGSEEVVIAIADTGCHVFHEDIAGNLWQNPFWPPPYPAGLDFGGPYGMDWFDPGPMGADPDYECMAPEGEDCEEPDWFPYDFNGHGSHVAGIASAVTDNGVGIAGVARNARLMCLRVGASFWATHERYEAGLVSMTAAASALYYANFFGAVAFNASWGSSNDARVDFDPDVHTYARPLEAALRYMRRSGSRMTIVVAAGNENRDIRDGGQPGYYLSATGIVDAITVAATDRSGKRADSRGLGGRFSNFGRAVDVSAPGVGILSVKGDHNVHDLTDRYVSYPGTSMAAPVVTGLVALATAYRPDLGPDEIREAVEASCYPLNPESGVEGARQALMGAGIVDAGRTLQYLRTHFNRPPTAPRLRAPRDRAVYGRPGDPAKITFRWYPSNDPDGDEVTYTLELSPGGVWSKVVVYRPTPRTATSLSIPVDELDRSGYEWRVAASDGVHVVRSTTTGMLEIR